MTTFIDLSSDDRLWVKVIPAADLIDLFWVPHQFVRDVAGRKLTDAFVIQFIERTAGEQGFVASSGMHVSPDAYVVSGIDNTGVVTVEGVAQDHQLGGARLPTSTGLDSAFTKVDQAYYGGLHADVRGDLRAAAATMVMAIRHRTTLATLISGMRWNQRIVDGSGSEVRTRANVKYNIQFASGPIIYAHGTEETYPQSCHAIPGFIKTEIDLGRDVIVDTLPLTLTGLILKAN